MNCPKCKTEFNYLDFLFPPSLHLYKCKKCKAILTIDNIGKIVEFIGAIPLILIAIFAFFCLKKLNLNMYFKYTLLLFSFCVAFYIALCYKFTKLQLYDEAKLLSLQSKDFIKLVILPIVTIIFISIFYFEITHNLEYTPIDIEKIVEKINSRDVITKKNAITMAKKFYEIDSGNGEIYNILKDGIKYCSFGFIGLLVLQISIIKNFVSRNKIIMEYASKRE